MNDVEHAYQTRTITIRYCVKVLWTSFYCCDVLADRKARVLNGRGVTIYYIFVMCFIKSIVIRTRSGRGI